MINSLQFISTKKGKRNFMMEFYLVGYVHRIKILYT